MGRQMVTRFARLRRERYSSSARGHHRRHFNAVETVIIRTRFRMSMEPITLSLPFTMKLTTLIISAALLGATTASQAEMVKVFENIRGTTVYSDSSTLSVNGDLRRIVEIQSYRNPGPRGMLSMKILKEYNCRSETTQIVSYTMYAERMARGSMIGQVNTPGSVDKLTKNPGGAGGWRFACGK